MLSLKMMMDCLVNKYNQHPDGCRISKIEDGSYRLQTGWGSIIRDDSAELPFVFRPADKKTAELASFLTWFSQMGRVDTKIHSI